MGERILYDKKVVVEYIPVSHQGQCPKQIFYFFEGIYFTMKKILFLQKNMHLKHNVIKT